MARLPTPGSDNGTWGDILNSFLSQAHDADGTLKSNSVGSGQIQTGAVTNTKLAAGTISEAKLDSAVQTKLNTAGGPIPSTDITDSTATGRAVLTAASAAAARTAIGAGTVNTAADIGLDNVDDTSDATKNSDVATLTNKTIDLTDNTVTGTLAEFNTAVSDADLVSLAGIETLTNKTIDGNNNTISNLAHGAEVDNPSSGVHGVTGNVVGTSDTQVLTNKTISVDTNTISGIANSSFVMSDGSGNIDGAAAQKAIPSGVVVGTSDPQTISAKIYQLGLAQFNSFVSLSSTSVDRLVQFTGSSNNSFNMPSAATYGYRLLIANTSDYRLILDRINTDQIYTGNGLAAAYTVAPYGNVELVSDGTNWSVTSEGGALIDNQFVLVDETDVTKKAKFQLSGITASNTRTLTIPDADTTIVGTDVTQILTSKTIDGDNNTISNLDIGLEVDWAAAGDVADRTAFASGDKLLIYEAGVGLRKIDYDDLPSGSGDMAAATYDPAGVNEQLVGETATQTLTNKRVTPRTGSVASSATPSIDTDDVDVFQITALATDITSMTTNLTGTPAVGQQLTMSINDDGTSRSITWGASFASSGMADLPTSTVPGNTHWVGLIWDGSVWACMASDAVGY